VDNWPSSGSALRPAAAFTPAVFTDDADARAGGLAGIRDVGRARRKGSRIDPAKTPRSCNPPSGAGSTTTALL